MSFQTPTAQRPIDPLLFDWPADEPALRACRCTSCGAMAFPVNPSCMNCGHLAPETFALPRRGTLWAWTIQRFMPKTPYASDETESTFEPYGVGYVELPGALRIETRLTTADPSQLKIGMEVELVFYRHRTDANGTAVINYAFSPAGTGRPPEEQQP